ncbi:hypothetical protein IAR50_007286 [Cryptococcus sp. DSM 104548]
MPPPLHPTFTDLTPLHPRILLHLALLAPCLVLSLSSTSYDEYIAVVYQRAKLKGGNIKGYFEGWLDGIGWERVGRKWGPASNGRGRSKRKRLPSFPHLPTPLVLPPLSSSSAPPSPFIPDSSSQTPLFPQNPRDTRKFSALSHTTHLTLLDAPALSTLCAAHVQILSRSPIIQTSSGSRRSSAEEQWPLGAVRTLEAGWDLVWYLADSHAPVPRFESVPICCIPLDISTLIVNLGELPNADLHAEDPSPSSSFDDDERVESGARKWMEEAISELASEFRLSLLELRVPSSSSTISIPVFRYPPFPAPLLRISFLPSSSSTKTQEEAEELAKNVVSYVRQVGNSPGPRVEFLLPHSSEIVRRRVGEMVGEGEKVAWSQCRFFDA